MSNRYDKIGPLIAFQQKSHYQHIQNPRATIRIDPPTRKSHSLHYKTKTTNQRERQRKMENKKMLFHLLEIYNGQGLLQKMETSCKQIDQKKNRVLLKSFKQIQDEKQIRKENKELMINIQNAQPIVGNKKDWDRHFQQHREIQRKLCNNSVRNGTNISAFKTFYHQKRRKLISEEKGKSLRSSEQKLERQAQGIQGGGKKEHKRRRLRKKQQKQGMSSAKVSSSNPIEQ